MSLRLGVAFGLGVALTIVAAANSPRPAPDRQPLLALPVMLPPQATPSDSPWIVRVPRPTIPPGPRRVGIQAGHWKIQEVPEEMARLRVAGGSVWGDVSEWEYALDIAQRVVTKIEAKGFVVDLLPATVPEQYFADAFVSLHADGDVTATTRGYKVAHGVRRGPYEKALADLVGEEYAQATGLPLDSNITEDMWDYYAFRWERFRATVSPHTPAAILEMGFISHPADRAVLLGRRDAVAEGVANGVLRFLAEVPPQTMFRDDLVLPRRTPAPDG
jgi:hypothetical protein